MTKNKLIQTLLKGGSLINLKASVKVEAAITAPGGAHVLV
jgi:hypothetical protein